MTGGEGAAAGRRGARRWGWGARAALAAIALLGLCAALPACDRGGRFPVCKTNADCAATDAGTGEVCFNLRCVACRYDTDCPSPQVCSSTNECVALSGAAPPPEDKGKVNWDPGSWKECAESCKDEACLKKCSERFEH